MDQYRYVNGKQLRLGYTTGTCAAAAAKAASQMLLEEHLVEEVSILTPMGIEVDIPIMEPKLGGGTSTCYVCKDGGDDPDATHGMKIYAQASYIPEDRIEVEAGEGIGRVTKPGLAVEVGQAAINPVPMKMILQEVERFKPQGKGIRIFLSAPEGVEIAQKTFNPILGIEGGISILGTRGIVIPMSDEAYKESLALKLSMLKEEGVKEVVFMPGNYGERFIGKHYDLDANRLVMTSNFIGYMIDEAIRHSFTKILLIGHIGKLIKLAGGIFHTHSRVADSRNEIFCSHYLKYTLDMDNALKIMESNTTEGATQFVADKSFYTYLSNQIKKRIERYSRKAIEAEVVIFAESTGLLGQSSLAGDWMETYFNNK